MISNPIPSLSPNPSPTISPFLRTSPTPRTSIRPTCNNMSKPSNLSIPSKPLRPPSLLQTPTTVITCDAGSQLIPSRHLHLLHQLLLRSLSSTVLLSAHHIASLIHTTPSPRPQRPLRNVLRFFVIIFFRLRL